MQSWGAEDLVWKRSERVCIQVRLRGRFLQGKVSGSEGFAAKGFDEASKVLSGRFGIEVRLRGRFWRTRLLGAKSIYKVSRVLRFRAILRFRSCGKVSGSEVFEAKAWDILKL